MPFIPHTDDDTREMLETIGAKSLDDLFDEIPKDLIIESLDGVPEALSEMAITRLMRERAMQDGAPQIWPDNPGNVCFVKELGDKDATEAVLSGRSVRLRPLRSVNVYISLPTMSLDSPTLRTKRSVSSMMGVRISR